MGSYIKLKSGDWGIKVEGKPKEWDAVQVKTKAGAVKTETVGKVIWSGNGVSICTIADSSAPKKSGGKRNGTECHECGHVFYGSACTECGGC